MKGSLNRTQGEARHWACGRAGEVMSRAGPLAGMSHTLEDSRNINSFLIERPLVSYRWMLLQIGSEESVCKALACWPIGGSLGTKRTLGLRIDPMSVCSPSFHPFMPSSTVSTARLLSGSLWAGCWGGKREEGRANSPITVPPRSPGWQSWSEPCPGAADGQQGGQQEGDLWADFTVRKKQVGCYRVSRPLILVNFNSIISWVCFSIISP